MAVDIVDKVDRQILFLIMKNKMYLWNFANINVSILVVGNSFRIC